VTDDIEFEVPEMSVPDEAAIRRAVLRGILRSSLAAASWLLVVVIVAVIAIGGIGAVRAKGLANIVDNGFAAAHPEYDVDIGPFTNLGVTTIDLNVRPRGALGHPGWTPGRITQPIFGGLEVDLGPKPDTPLGDALARKPPSRDTVEAFLNQLPKNVSVSAVVQLAKPLRAEEIPDVVDPGYERSDAPYKGRSECAFLNDPYSSDRVVSWSRYVMPQFVHWARGLDSSDDDLLNRVGLPSSSALHKLAEVPMVHGYVIERASPREVSVLLADDRVRSLNVFDIGYDPVRQFGDK
jgi:hypothetical protein